ncbi:hypothetical protein F1640_04660 [Novosphingobium sp. NBM11]|uniref:nuclear transport factor 2 family protein n=1 Tax=Novosphingobium sp. NBM11 TaxID=2596914 RepID=UPI0018926395|nr:nuclear transport factor 2 family protein [Novosphingobium sp. NBM11]MBF5089313.1 hypothetical protein [Novosphingobium sp. NBM11]
MAYQWVKDFFAAADSLDVERFCAALPRDIVWRFANFPTARGIGELRAQYEMVAQILESMRHEIVGIWDAGDCVTAETRVFYVDVHGREFDCPGCDIFLLRDGALAEVRIFVDNHVLFMPPAAAEPAALGEGVA